MFTDAMTTNYYAEHDARVCEYGADGHHRFGPFTSEIEAVQLIVTLPDPPNWSVVAGGSAVVTETRCRNCGRPIVVARMGPMARGREWLHRAIEPERHDFYYCTIAPSVPLSSNPHAEPEAVE